MGIEWLNPFFTSGHWVPEMIEISGGVNMITKTGEHSRKMEIEEIEREDPDVLILMPCGFDVQRTGSVGIDTAAKVTLTVNDTIPEVLYYKLVPIFESDLPASKSGVVIDTDVISGNEVQSKESRYNGTL